MQPSTSITDQLDQIQSKHEPTWVSGYRYFPQVIRQHGCKTGVEVGVAFGGHSEAILQETEVTKLYGVDAYQHRAGYDDEMNLPQPVFDALRDRTVQRLSRFDGRFELIRHDSVEAAQGLQETLDFVYLDADHSYEGVFRDLCAWFKKLRPGGILGGHDYGHPAFPGVKQAVDEFLRRFGWHVTVEENGVWWARTGPVHVSFIVPAYNCQTTIADTIASVLNGNLEAGDEIVVVDDCSTDNTPTILADLARQHPSLVVRTHPHNKGGAAARNTAVETARHPLLFCLDSDNLLLPASIPVLKSYFVDQGADVAAFREIRFFKDSNTHTITHRWEYPPGLFSLSDGLRTTQTPGASGNYLFSKESWVRAGGYPEFAGALDTWGFGFRQLATGSKMMVMPDGGYLHRQGHDSYWVRQERAGNVNLLALQVVLPFLHLIHPTDANYIMSSRGRHQWHSKLDQHSLRLHTPTGPSLIRKAARKLKRLARRVLPS